MVPTSPDTKATAMVATMTNRSRANASGCLSAKLNAGGRKRYQPDTAERTTATMPGQNPPTNAAMMIAIKKVVKVTDSETYEPTASRNRIASTTARTASPYASVGFFRSRLMRSIMP